MILSGKEIKKRLDSDIIITPFNEAQLNPNSYNLRLHNQLLVYKDSVLDMKKAHETTEIIIPAEGLLLQPHTLYLGRSVEHTQTRGGLVPMIEGRSSMGRLGLFVHITAGFGDVGFCGYWTLEIFCVLPIRIYPHVEICQIFYHLIEGDYHSYEEKKGKYQNNQGIQPSFLYKEFDNSKPGIPDSF
jgi:dCTP deaminase